MSKLEAQESCILDTEINCESRFECPICLGWLREPVLTKCGHRFCRLCIQSCLQKENACPLDHIKLDPAVDLFPDNFTKREILQQNVLCPYYHLGCTVKLSPIEIENHIAICKFKVAQELESASSKCYCLFQSIGCTGTFHTNEERQEHLTKNVNYHMNLLCNIYSQLKPHHDNTNDKAQESFFWDPPTKENSPESPDSIHNLLKVLYEKIVLLEQKNREQDIIITNMSQQITMLNMKVSELSLRHCNGSYLWMIKDFRTKLESMHRDPKTMWYSPGFYTSTNGYKLCMRLNISPNDSNYLAIFVHVMKTEHDFTLEWPLAARITFCLIHPSNSEMNIRETMLSNPKWEAFSQPKQSVNPKAFGYSEFVLIEDIQKQGYIKSNNELYIRIQVYTCL